MPRLEDMTEEEQAALRDRFAMAALQGLILSTFYVREEAVEIAWDYADRMMEARDAQRGEGDG